MTYRWVPREDGGYPELADAPSWLVDLLTAPKSPSRRASSPRSDDAEKFCAGARNAGLARLAGKLRRPGLSEPEILAALLAANRIRCDPPLEEDEVSKIARSIASYPPAVPQERGRSVSSAVPAPGGGPADALPVVELCTDMGNARRIAREFGSDLRYDRGTGWHVWDGRRWVRDDMQLAWAMAKQSARTIFEEASEAIDGEEAKRLGKWAIASQSVSRVSAALTLAESEPEIRARPEQFDRDPWLLTLTNGTLDLRTGTLRPHDRADMITRLAPVDYDPDARCPTWTRFLDRIMGNDPELVSFLQRAAGYSLSGVVSEQVWFFLYGLGANGKSTFLSALLEVFGDYGRQAAPDLLVAKKTEVHPAEVADLCGCRLAVCTEVGPGRSLDIVKIKQMTGGDRLKARYMRQDFFEFDPTFKIWLAANHKPTVIDTTESTWRRLILLPFEVQIPPAEQDRALGAKLHDELSGILNWAVDGALLWQREGLRAPSRVLVAGQVYRAEEDIVADFLDTCCSCAPDATIFAGDLYQTYAAWCIEEGEKPVSQKALGKRLTEKGFRRLKTGPQRRWSWLGLGKKSGLSGPLPEGEPIGAAMGSEGFGMGSDGRSGQLFDGNV